MEVAEFGTAKDGSGTMNIQRWTRAIAIKEAAKVRARANNQLEELCFSKEESYTCIKHELHAPFRRQSGDQIIWMIKSRRDTGRKM
jgi:hypothetical protein